MSRRVVGWGIALAAVVLVALLVLRLVGERRAQQAAATQALRSIIEAFGLQTVSSTFWGAQRVEELLMNPSYKAVYSPGNGEVEIYEIVIPANWHDRVLGDLLGPVGQCHSVALSRAGRAFLPERETKLQIGDLLMVSSTC